MSGISDGLRRSFFLIAAVYSLASIFTSTAHASDEVNLNPLTATVRLQPSEVGAGQTAELFFDMQVANHYHAYVDKFKVAVDSPDDLKIGDFSVSPVVPFMDSTTKKMRDGVENSGRGRAILEIPKGFKTGDHVAKIKLTYQACSKENCLFPKTITLDAPFKVVASVAGAAANNKAPPTAPAVATAAPSNDFERAIGQSMFMAILVVFGMGVITSLTPCIYPMIPITLAVLGARTKGQNKLKSFSLSLAYVLGIALTYSLLGVAAAKTGAMFGAALGNIYVVTAIGLLFVGMALSMYGVYELQVPAFIRNKVGTAQTGAGYGGAFATGLIAGIVASPCVGPVLVSVLTYIAQTQNLLLGFVLLFSFAMGLGMLFIVLGTSSSLISKMPKAGAWMDITKFVFGSVMIGMALYYVAPIYPKWLFHALLGLAVVMIASAYGAFEPNESLTTKGRIRKGAMLAAFAIGLIFSASGLLEKAGIALPTGAGGGLMAQQNSPKLKWQKFSEAALQTALAGKKPVVIDFYADWCGACKELEHETFTDARVRELSEKFTLLQVDATDDFEGLDQLKKTYGVMGLPTMIFYDRSGQVRKDLTLTGFENADKFTERMQNALAGLPQLNEVSQSSTAP